MSKINHTQRLQKILAQWGIASRRQAETMILAQRVRVNGRLVQLGDKADPQIDQIEVDGQIITHRPDPIYLLINKPKGVLTTCNDPQQRNTILDLLPDKLKKNQGIHPVGRLDADSTGALILTNDGELTFHLTHPSHHIPKTYQAWIQGCPPESTLQLWRDGIMLDGKKTLPAQIRQLDHKGLETSLIEITLIEGRNRQIRRVAEQLGYNVLNLHRTHIGSITLLNNSNSLAPGAYRHLTKIEIRSLNELLLRNITHTK